MATIFRQFTVAAQADPVWSAFRDVGAVHTRLARGFVADCVLNDDVRTVTFANGLIARERIVTIDDAARRVAYSIIDGQPTHHNASFQVIDTGARGCRVIWIADLLPDELAQPIGHMMEMGCEAMRKTLESGTK